MYKLGVMAAVGAISLSMAASAAELEFTVNWYGVGFIETFDVNTSIAGTPSAASAAVYGTSQDEDFAITNDNLGSSILQAGDAEDDFYFATGDSDDAAFYNCCLYTAYTSSAFYDGSTPYLQAYAGETVVGASGTTISVSAVPEPAAWAMTLIGAGSLGAALRRRRSPIVAAA